ELESKEALDFYQSHPLHVQVATNTVKPAATSRIVVDYEI
ncbi:Dabb family protein, partial [Turicibacter sanguinis]|nr:Dabb family protein [Turicibacter sanguinis]